MKKKNNLMKDILPYIILLVVMSIVLYIFNMGKNKVNELNYNDFTKKLNSQEVTELEMTPKASESVYYLTGKLK